MAWEANSGYGGLRLGKSGGNYSVGALLPLQIFAAAIRVTQRINTVWKQSMIF